MKHCFSDGRDGICHHRTLRWIQVPAQTSGALHTLRCCFHIPYLTHMCDKREKISPFSLPNYLFFSFMLIFFSLCRSLSHPSPFRVASTCLPCWTTLLQEHRFSLECWLRPLVSPGSMVRVVPVLTCPVKLMWH